MRRQVLASTIQLLADDATHVGVASDHTIESFRAVVQRLQRWLWYAAELAMQIRHGRCS